MIPQNRNGAKERPWKPHQLHTHILTGDDANASEMIWRLPLDGGKGRHTLPGATSGTVRIRGWDKPLWSRKGKYSRPSGYKRAVENRASLSLSLGLRTNRTPPSDIWNLKYQEGSVWAEKQKTQALPAPIAAHMYCHLPMAVIVIIARSAYTRCI